MSSARLTLRRSPSLGRRAFEGWALATLMASAFGCAATPPVVKAQPLPPLDTENLTDLCTSAGLEWIVLVRPREIAQIDWLIPEIALFASEANLDAFARDTGVDLRQIPEAVLARFDESLGSADLQIVRHHGDPELVERLFTKRITAELVHVEERPDLVRVGGIVGTEPHSMGRFGADVVLFQSGGSLQKGPLRVAALYAEKKLKKTPRALETEPLKSLRERFGSAPVIALAKGPFLDEWKSAAKGLLEAATGVGIAMRPTAREHLGIAIAIASDFHTSGAEASDVLVAAWKDFADTEMGSLLGLNQPIEPPIPTHSDDAVALSIEVDAHRFATGLHALVSEDVGAIMKL
jgi:hypothetical protein